MKENFPFLAAGLIFASAASTPSPSSLSPHSSFPYALWKRMGSEGEREGEREDWDGNRGMEGGRKKRRISLPSSGKKSRAALRPQSRKRKERRIFFGWFRNSTFASFFFRVFSAWWNGWPLPTTPCSARRGSTS